jgi:hypothetical protein
MSKPKSESEGKVEVKMWVQPGKIKDLQDAGYRPELQYPAATEQAAPARPMMGQCAPTPAVPKAAESDAASLSSVCELSSQQSETTEEPSAKRRPQVGGRQKRGR